MRETVIRNKAPEIKSISSLKIIQPKHYTLSNGVKVAVFENNTQDLLKINLVFDAGSRNCKKPLIASTVNNMLTEVTNNYTATELAEKIDFFGAYFETNTTRDYASVALYSLHTFLDDTLPLLAEVVQNASFNQEQLQAYIQRKRQEFTVNSEKVDFIARQRFTSLLFGEEHPYGRYSRIEDFEAIKRKDIVEFYRKYYLEAGFKIYIAGNFTQREIDLLDRYFGAMPNKELIKQDDLWKVNPSFEKVVDIEKKGAVQNALRMGFIAPHRYHHDYFGLKILSTILGGYFGSRLMNNIREDKGYTYGIGSALSSFQKASVFFISTEIKSEVCEMAIEEIYNELDKLKNKTVGNNELQTVKNYLQGSFQRGLDGTFNLLDRYLDLDLSNLDFSFYEDYIEKIISIEASELKELAIKYYNEKNIYLLNVGKIR